MHKPVALAIGIVLASSVSAQSPLKAEIRKGRACQALAPADWSFIGENAAGSAFGADMQRADGQVLASYFIVGVAGEMRTSSTYARWYATPHQAAMTTLTQMGRVAVQCGAPSTPAPGLTLMPCRTPQFVGLAFSLFGMVMGSFIPHERPAAHPAHPHAGPTAREP